MPTTYIYKARNLQGKLVKGRGEFSTKSELAEALKKEGLLLIDIKAETSGFELSALLKRIRLFKAEKAKVKEKRDIFEVFQRISPIDIMSFSLHLSNLLEAGITLLDALGTLVQQTTNRKFKKVVESLHRDVEGGSSFSIALEVYPQVFSPLFINMVRLGEATGRLDKTLTKITEFIEHNMALKQKVKSALTYPAILITLGFLVVMFITTLVMPQFVKMFKESGVPLSLPTLIVYGFGQAVKEFWYLFLFGAIFLIIGMKFCLKTESARLAFDHLILKIPVIGPLVHKVILSRFAMTLSVLLAAGVPLLESLEMVEKMVGNVVIAKTINGARSSISKGAKIADALRMGGRFPLDVIQMIAVGEETGGLDKMLAKIANFYDIAVDNAITTLTAFIEPIFLLIMGLIVGFIMFSMFLPLFKLVQTVGM